MAMHQSINDIQIHQSVDFGLIQDYGFKNKTPLSKIAFPPPNKLQALEKLALKYQMTNVSKNGMRGYIPYSMITGVIVMQQYGKKIHRCDYCIM